MLARGLMQKHANARRRKKRASELRLKHCVSRERWPNCNGAQKKHAFAPRRKQRSGPKKMKLVGAKLMLASEKLKPRLKLKPEPKLPRHLPMYRLPLCAWNARCQLSRCRIRNQVGVTVSRRSPNLPAQVPE